MTKSQTVRKSVLQVMAVIVAVATVVGFAVVDNEIAKALRSQDYPEPGRVRGPGSSGGHSDNYPNCCFFLVPPGFP